MKLHLGLVPCPTLRSALTILANGTIASRNVVVVAGSFNAALIDDLAMI